MPSAQIKVDRTNVVATINGKQTLMLHIPAMKVDISYKVDNDSGQLAIESAAPLDLDMDHFEEVRNKRFPIRLPYQGRPGQSFVGAWRFDLTEPKAVLEVGVERSWDPSECGGKQGGTPPRPHAKPDYYFTGRSIITFKYKQTNELFEYTVDGWQFKADKEYESGSRKIEGGWSRPMLVQEYTVVCMLPPKGARYSHPERLNSPVLRVDIA